MKYARKIDANQPEIVKALRAAGCTVEHLHAVGSGCPDLLCAIDNHTFLIEVKDGAKPPSEQKLTPHQIEWHAGWKAPVHIVNSIDGALAVVVIYKQKEAA
jgi:Holliday junction resolvase